MFHSRNGLFFQATGQGNVAIVATNDGKAPFSRSSPDSDKVETNIVCNVTLPENEWASVVCSVSKDGETAERWKRARLFHGTELSQVFPGATLEEPSRAPTAEEEEWMNAPMGTPAKGESLEQAVDRVMQECGFLLQDDRRVSLGVLGDQYRMLKERVMDLGNLGTEIGNLQTKYHEQHMVRVRAADAAHRKRLGIT